MIIILILVIVALVILFVWNGTTLRSLKKESERTDKQLTDPKYWELKYKFEFLVAMVGIITAVIGLLGYNSLNNIESTIKLEFDKKVDSIQTRLDNTVSQVDTKLNNAKDSVQKLTSDVSQSQTAINDNARNLSSLNNQQQASRSNLTNLSKQIDEINSKNKVKKEFYLVNDIPVRGYATIKFADLVTSAGDKLPVFTRPPFVIPAASNLMDFSIRSTSTTEFQILVNNYDDKRASMETSTFLASVLIRESN